jgi:membrane-bound metal-dependent hydrolase YbcI (DUF457 family)
MALPIAHATAGYLLHRLDRRGSRFGGWPRALTYMAIGNLPDADFLLGFVTGHPGHYHRGFSHTVLAAVVFGATAGALLAWRIRDRWLSAAAMLATVYGSHLLLDALTIDERGPAGAQFFWPFSDAYYVFPFTVFTEIIIDGTSRLGFLGTVFAWPTLVVLVREIALATIAIGTVVLVENLIARLRANGVAVADARGEDLA